MKKVIIFKEQQGIRVFDASTDELLAQACVKVLNERKDSNFFRYNPEPLQFNPTPTEQGYLNLTDEDLAALPEEVAESLRKKQRSLQLRKSSVNRANADSKHWYGILQKVLSLPYDQQLTHTTTLLPNTPYAREINTVFWLLKERTQYVGESFTIENIETI